MTSRPCPIIAVLIFNNRRIIFLVRNLWSHFRKCRMCITDWCLPWAKSRHIYRVWHFVFVGTVGHIGNTWWHNDMNILSVLLALYDQNLIVTGRFHSQRANYGEFWCFYWGTSGQQTVQLLVIRAAHVTLLLCHRWFPLKKANDDELCFLRSAPEQTFVQAIETPAIWDAIASSPSLTFIK